MALVKYDAGPTLSQHWLNVDQSIPSLEAQSFKMHISNHNTPHLLQVSNLEEYISL